MILSRRSHAPVSIAMFLILIAFCGATVLAQDHDVILRAEFSVDLSPPPRVSAFSDVVEPSYVARIPDGEAAVALLSAARWSFGGLIWGFDYVYTPSDRSRSVDELFTLTPRWSETADQLELKPVTARLDGTVLLVEVECYPDTVQRQELASWKLASAAEQGVGTASALGREQARASQVVIDAKREAVNAAVREALRSYLREVTHNKPREVRGTCAFTRVPRVFMREGQWVAIVRIYARVDEIVSYGIY